MLDLRSTWLAAAAWVGAAAGWFSKGMWPTVAAVAALLAGAMLWRFREAVPVVLIGFSGLVVGGLGSAALGVPVEAVGHAAGITARVTGLPRQLDVGMARPPAMAVPVAITGIRSGNTQWTLDVPARVIADAEDLSVDVRPGSLITFQGRIQDRSATETNVPVQLLAPARQITPPDGGIALVDALRRGLAESAGTSDAGSLVAGIAIGDESGQRPELAAAMRESGLSHLTAVSGGNFMVLLGTVLIFARWARGSLATQVVVSGLALAVYGVVVGPQPSVLRAATMAVAGLIGIMIGGASRGCAVLSSAVTVLLLASPELAWSLGFGLSVAATAGLQVVAPRFSRVLTRVLPRWLSASLSIALSAHLATAPLLLAIGSPVSWVAVPANLLVSPLAGIITVLGVMGALTALVSAPLAALPVSVAAALAGVIVRVAFAGQALASSPVGPFVWRGIVVATVGIVVTWLLVAIAGRRWVGPVSAGIAVVCLLVLRSTGPPPDWRLIVCDVGQGTAILARSDRAVVLFDAGPDRGDTAGCLAAAGVGHLDAVVLSHFHADHVAGLPDILTSRSTTSVLATSAAALTPTVAAVDELARAHGNTLDRLSEGQRIAWGDLTGVVLWPPAGERVTADDVNNGSLVMLVEWPDGFRALIPGDIEPESQSQIMRRWRLRDVDVAVIPHHGSDHQDPGFADWVLPQVAVASAGAGNSYGHPAASTLSEYTGAGSQVYRTDADGTVVVSVQDHGAVVTTG